MRGLPLPSPRPAKAPPAEGPGLLDGMGRTIRYLRLSVTDSCNFACAYCGPAVGSSAEGGCTASELARLTGAFVRLGVRGVRVTGGEPLLRGDILAVVGQLRALGGDLDLSLTTNGFGLASLARPLREAGLNRVNVSLDSMDPVAFGRLSGVAGLEAVWRGICEALDAGLSPVKLNVVVVAGLNDGEIPAFADLAQRRPLHVRFIELMPFGPTAYGGPGRRVSLREMMRLAGPLEAVAPGEGPGGFGPARVFRRPGAEGTLGFIAALSGRFCGDCNRVRLTSRGLLLPCLAGDEGADLLGPLRAGAGEPELEALIRGAVSRKPPGHAFGGCSGARAGGGLGMCGIGG